MARCYRGRHPPGRGLEAVSNGTFGPRPRPKGGGVQDAEGVEYAPKPDIASGPPAPSVGSEAVRAEVFPGRLMRPEGEESGADGPGGGRDAAPRQAPSGQPDPAEVVPETMKPQPSSIA